MKFWIRVARNCVLHDARKILYDPLKIQPAPVISTTLGTKKSVLILDNEFEGLLIVGVKKSGVYNE
jgi:hypothetical protein